MGVGQEEGKGNLATFSLYFRYPVRLLFGPGIIHLKSITTRPSGTR